MANLNKVLLIGNLTRDPELRVTPGGLSICKFGLAVNRNFTDKNGEKREETTFVDIDAFGRQAETISKYVTKGKPLLVEGRLKLDQWEDKNSGEKRSRLGVVLENFQFLGGRESDGGGGGGGYSEDSGSSSPEQHSPPPRKAAASRPPAAAPDDLDEDVPF
jgi:single-strand DNA-binding protein